VQLYYLIGALLYSLPWILIFLARPDLRRCLLLMSILCMPLGASDAVFIPHYWRPITLFGWVPGVESFVFAFNTGGLAGTLYKVATCGVVVLDPRIASPAVAVQALLLIVAPILLGWMFPHSPFAIHLGYIEAVTMSIGAGLIVMKRRDLSGEILAGGTLFLLLHFGVLLLLDRVVFPGWIEGTWNFQILSGIRLAGAPVEDLLWAFTLGAVWAPLYEVLMGGRLIRRPLGK
jgi:hypothetical protein